MVEVNLLDPLSYLLHLSRLKGSLLKGLVLAFKVIKFRLGLCFLQQDLLCMFKFGYLGIIHTLLLLELFPLLLDLVSLLRDLLDDEEVLILHLKENLLHFS